MLPVSASLFYVQCQSVFYVLCSHTVVLVLAECHLVSARLFCVQYQSVYCCGAIVVIPVECQLVSASLYYVQCHIPLFETIGRTLLVMLNQITRTVYCTTV